MPFGASCHFLRPLPLANILLASFWKMSSAKRTSKTGNSSSPPLKRQKIGAASSSTAVYIDDTAARIRQLEQRLQSSEDKNARLEERLQQQEEEIQRQKEDNNQRLIAMRKGMIRHGPSWNGKTTDVDIIDNLTRLSPLAMHYNANVTNQFIRDIPEMLWWQKILQPFLNLEDLSILRRTNTFFQSYWESVLAQNTIRVPQGCPTLEKAMDLAVIFSERQEYTTDDPLKIRLDEGVHEIVGFFDKDYGQHGQHRKFLNVTCSHITFVGKGKDHTTIRGGFRVRNQQNVRFEELTSTNPGDDGLKLRGSQTNVDMLKCAVKECGGTGLVVQDGATVTATQCEFMENGGNGVFCSSMKARFNDCQMHHNGRDGVAAYTHATVIDIHGTTTDIHSNKTGIAAWENAEVNIHLPSQHNTSHDNVEEDRKDFDGILGGSIANINADGTFTHVHTHPDYGVFNSNELEDW
jgi:hypothetical protein